jgi:hypothetical protein
MVILDRFAGRYVHTERVDWCQGEKLDSFKSWKWRAGQPFISTEAIFACSMMASLARLAPLTQFGVAKGRILDVVGEGG